MIQREGEQWKNIIKFPIYQISNFGNVRNTLKEKELKPRIQTSGYYYVTLCKKNVKQNRYVHRLVCQYFNANPNNYQFVDHSSGNKLDNRAENLRFCTQQQNSMNRKKMKNTSSQFKGVSFYNRNGKWQAQIRLNGKSIHLGLFTNEEEAARQYDLRAIELFQEFAKTNFPRENYNNKIINNYFSSLIFSFDNYLVSVRVLGFCHVQWIL